MRHHDRSRPGRTERPDSRDRSSHYCPPAYGVKVACFFAAYPDMAVELAASESPTTIIEDGFDLAIHHGDLPDSTLVARRFAQTMIILVATTQYLTRHGAPASPDDLHGFRSVVFVE